MINPLYRNANFKLDQPLICDFNSEDLFYVYNDPNSEEIIIKNQHTSVSEINTLSTTLRNFKLLVNYNTNSNSFEIINIFLFENSKIHRASQQECISEIIKQISGNVRGAPVTFTYRPLYNISEIFNLNKEFILILNNNSNDFCDELFVINNNNSIANRTPSTTKSVTKNQKITKTNKPEIYLVEENNGAPAGLLYLPNIKHCKYLRTKLSNSISVGTFDCKFNQHFNKWQLNF